jgi:hypothetical protein
MCGIIVFSPESGIQGEKKNDNVQLCRFGASPDDHLTPQRGDHTSPVGDRIYKIYKKRHRTTILSLVNLLPLDRLHLPLCFVTVVPEDVPQIDLRLCVKMPSTDLSADLQRFLAWSIASPSHFLLTVIGGIALWHVVPFITNSAAITIPGPLAAKFSDFWLMRQAMKGKRFLVVHDLHKKHGKHTYRSQPDEQLEC